MCRIVCAERVRAEDTEQDTAGRICCPEQVGCETDLGYLPRRCVRGRERVRGKARRRELDDGGVAGRQDVGGLTCENDSPAGEIAGPENVGSSSRKRQTAGRAVSRAETVAGA